VADMAGTTHLARQTFSLGQSRAAVDAEPGAIGQYALNALYLNVGGGRFLEIARLAGVDRTDWTWSVLFGDFDNDGWQDLHVTNGMLRDFANADLIARMRRADSPAQAALIARRSPVLAQENLAFRNTGALRFEETSAAWGLQDDGVSFGAVAADLDGDGDLDLVYTNLDRPVSLFRNDSDAARVSIVLRGRGANPFAVGARVIGTTSAGSSARQVTLARGTLSSAPAEVHFGLGRDTALARLEIHWPDGRVQVAENLPENRRYVFQQPPAPFGPAAPPGPPAGLFRDITAGTDLVGVRLGRRSEAGKLQPLLPLQRPAVGPGIAAGDADGDGDPDIYFAGSPGALYLNEGDGRFIPDPRPQPWNAETAGTETTPLWFDADGDGDLDLLVPRADDTIAARAPTSAARLYLNDGAGVFQVAPADRFPAIDGNASVAAAADFDGDGDLDLFIGGATKAGRYPLPAGSRLLENRRGVFVPSPLPIARGLSELGRVTGALWADVNGDHWPDLVVVAEWAPLRLFLNQAGRGLVDATDRTGCAAIEGWWRALTPADVDGDGDIDLIAGNIGLNTSYQATVTEPVRLYFGDFDESGASQILEAYFERGRLLPRRNYATLVRMFPTLRRQFQGAADFGRASLDEIFVLDDALKLEATQLAHGVFLNDGTGRFEFRELPRLAQAAPVNAIAARDFDGDGCVDLLLVQNDASPPPEVPRFDGGRGLFLHGHGDGTFTPLRPEESGIDLPEPVRSLVLADLNGDAQDEVLLASEDGRLRVLAVRETKPQ
ncbi:MAG TPA: VCBS repeat-containing protein, partial [Opitutus sp.]|nr:VCBS repeat-containing protein [Opitutus sp.]